ncbi:MAG: hypothetical protein JO168_26950 [Solirubrobacterales bacterium]|nr:hypothetical protein [Solirubrobacterales bacterium]MBV9713942.1 hypothetical protein [Solirubrobacterales bacterium]
MTGGELKRRLRRRSEYALRLAALRDVGRRYPNRTETSALPPVGLFWRFVFVPLFRRVPWTYKRQAMRTFRMTARGWREDARRFGEPWRPPAPNGHTGEPIHRP